MLETFEDWKYQGCSCNAKLTLNENDKYTCKKCPGWINAAEPK